jgi:hypothetical protein
MTRTLLLNSPADSANSAIFSTASEELAEQLEQVMQQDRDFFLHHPEQDYYVRPITPVEVAEGRSLGKAVTPEALVLVGEIAPGSRIRLTILDGGEAPVKEFKTMQKQMRKEMGIKAIDLKDKLRKQQKQRPKGKGFGTTDQSEA